MLYRCFKDFKERCYPVYSIIRQYFRSHNSNRRHGITVADNFHACINGGLDIGLQIPFYLVEDLIHQVGLTAHPLKNFLQINETVQNSHGTDNFKNNCLTLICQDSAGL